MVDTSITEVAFLLQQLVETASVELNPNDHFIKTKRPDCAALIKDMSDGSSCEDSFNSIAVTTDSFRSISFSSQASPLLPPLKLPSRPISVSPTLHAAESHVRVIGPQLMLAHWNHADANNESVNTSKPNMSKYVGTKSPHKVRGILKRKFSWKNYPELEDFLIEKREEYLCHSSEFNYTVAQKDFNNNLTKDILDLASSLGYVFERFSFVQVRDRIRCYYKSYLQSQKKAEQRQVSHLLLQTAHRS